MEGERRDAVRAVGDLAALVLCAGLGTRLRPLTDRVPKPAVPVCGIPLVRWNLALLRGAGARRAVVNVHHLPEAMARAAQDAGAALGLPVAVSREPVIAGTGGALREARALLGEAREILLVNGDVLFDVDLAEALAAHRASGALATMVLLPMPPGARYAAVEVDGAGAVRRIAGAFGPGGDGLTPWHFSGVHVLSAALLDRVPAAPFECDVNRHVYPPLMAEGLVRGFVASGPWNGRAAAGGYWNDLGTPARYLRANLDVLRGRVPLARFPGIDPLAGEVPSSHALVARSARIQGAGRLRDAVVGERCVVPAGAIVERAVLWDGTALAPGEQVVDAIAAADLRVPATGE
ncbi:MAG TPA: nucleotidyltransferase family protein [Anaeromyxobacteraceae bacterium]|nr:nucleotidyltransferase family protein [Anaeromyxobacteraceae bacterium]